MKTSTKLVAAAFGSTIVIEASNGDGETNDDAKEQQESARLQSLAKITPQQAKLAASKV